MTFRERLRAVLLEQGPLHCQELAEVFDLPSHIVRAKIGKLRATWPGEIRIAEWRREEWHGHLYPRACYGVGAEPDAPRPRPLTRSQYNRRYKGTVKHQVNSVWALATRVADRRRAG